MTTKSASGIVATYAGVTLTVPKIWRAVGDGPEFCGSVVGRSAYFYVGSTSPPPGCSAAPATGPFVSVECRPYGPPPTGHEARVGPFNAIVIPNTTTGEPIEEFIYLTGRDTLIDLYGRSATVHRIESSITDAKGSC
jgi:hypothetical protein